MLTISHGCPRQKTRARQTIDELIGLHWGFGPGEVDCFRLMVEALKVLRDVEVSIDRPVTAMNNAALSLCAEDEFSSIFNRAEAPRRGVVGVWELGRMYHIGTFLAPGTFLHVLDGGKSHITRFRGVYVDRLRSLWEVRPWELEPSLEP